MYQENYWVGWDISNPEDAPQPIQESHCCSSFWFLANSCLFVLAQGDNKCTHFSFSARKFWKASVV